MVEKTIKIGGKEVKFRTSAALPRIYRIKFGRDIFRDFSKLVKYATRDAEQESDEIYEALTIFENVAYIFAKHADSTIPDDIEKWLQEFDTFDMYGILPELLDMWIEEQKTTVEPKKDNEQ